MVRLLIQRVDINFPGLVGWEELSFRSSKDIGREDTSVAYLWLTQAQARTLPPLPVFQYMRSEYWEPSNRPLDEHQVFMAASKLFTRVFVEHSRGIVLKHWAFKFGDVGLWFGPPFEELYLAARREMAEAAMASLQFMTGEGGEFKELTTMVLSNGREIARLEFAREIVGVAVDPEGSSTCSYA